MSLFFAFFIVLLNFLLYRLTLNFSLSGDDWLTLYRAHTTFNGPLSYFNIKLYSGNYDVANIIMDIISSFFKYNPKPYFIIAILLRSIACISFYFPTRKLLKDSKYSQMSVLLFTFSFAGIQSVDWVFNMNSYLSIIFFNIFLARQILSIKSRKFNQLLSQSLLIFLSFAIAPNRMHILIFIIPTIEFVISYTQKKKSWFITLTRIIILLLPIIIFRKLTAQTWDTSYLSMIKKFMAQNIFLSFKILFTNLSAALLPDTIFSFKIAVLLLILLILVFVFSNRKIAKLGIVALLFALFSELVPVLIYSKSIFPSSHRYHIMTSVFFIFVLVVLFKLLSSKYSKLVGYSFLFIFIISNIYSVNSYLTFLYKNGRNQHEVNVIFSEIETEVSTLPTDSLTVFYFTSDNPQYLYNAVSFGFTPHMILLNPQFIYRKEIAPLVVDNKISLNKVMHNDVEELSRYGYKQKYTKIGKVYYMNINKGHIYLTKELNTL